MFMVQLKTLGSTSIKRPAGLWEVYWFIMIKESKSERLWKISLRNQLNTSSELLQSVHKTQIKLLPPLRARIARNAIITIWIINYISRKWRRVMREEWRESREGYNRDHGRGRTAKVVLTVVQVQGQVRVLGLLRRREAVRVIMIND
jgi:hypothetical protein